MGKLDFFLGLEAKRSQKGLLLSQTKYASDLLHKLNMQDCKSVFTPMVVGSNFFPRDSPVFDKPTMYTSVIGALQYLTLTRLDLSYAINKSSQFLKEPTQLQWQAVKRVLRYIQGTLEYGLMFKPSLILNLEVFSNADWAGNLEYKRSTSGYCIYLEGNLVQWSSKKRRVVAFSSTESKYEALSQATTKVKWLRSLFSELDLEWFSQAVIVEE
ncbi:secreted RxLR effector protein 161-like [Mangifera indica]|uniref:secreted RxLR effector protein 161-like n=1 Tax=Mangifera indica TaxID=29780 RepID=UPI001CF946DD|nr:secreted RxLR effector protein 161-like [Mangifera indica]